MIRRRLNQQRPTRKVIITLVAALLLTQWLVITHFHKQIRHAPDSVCSVCLTGQHFNHALGNSLVLFARQLAPQVEFLEFATTLLQQFVPAFHSRAPPVLL